MFKQNCLYFSLCLLPLVLSLGTTKKSGSVFSPHQVFIHTQKIPTEPSLLQTKQSQPSQPPLL